MMEQLHVNGWVEKFSQRGEDDYSGYVTSEEEVYAVIAAYEKETGSNFKSVSSTKPGKKALHKYKVLKPDLQKEKYLLNHPYQSVNRRYYECKYGPDRNRSKKKKEETVLEHCPAKLIAKELVFFTEYKGDSDEDCKRVRLLCKTDPQQLVSQKMFHVQLAQPSNHQNHPQQRLEEAACIIGNGVNELDTGFTCEQDQALNDINDQTQGEALLNDPRVLSKIKDLVEKGFTSASTVRGLLKMYVQQEMSTTYSISRRFFPSQEDIGQKICEVQAERFASGFDEKSFKLWFSESKDSAPHDNFHYERSGKNSNFLFVYQSKEQKVLLAHHGNYTCILDPTYRTLKHNIPLFFLVVNTVVGLAVAAVFATQFEDAESIKAALTKIREWNTEWTPTRVLTDNSDPMLNALSKVFPGCKVEFGFGYCVRAWESWLKESNHKRFDRTNASNATWSVLLNITMSASVEKLQENLKTIKRKSFWSANKAFQEWFENTWERHIERWVILYREPFIDDTDTEFFEYMILTRCSDQSFTGILMTTVNSFLPAKYKEYVEANRRSNNYIQKNRADIPDYLHDKHEGYVKHCRKQICALGDIDIQNMGDKTYRVKIRTDQGSAPCTTIEDVPDCSCLEYQQQPDFLPCKHYMAILFKHPDKWTDFPEWYRLNPVISIDTEFLTKPPIEEITSCRPGVDPSHGSDSQYSLLDEELGMLKNVLYSRPQTDDMLRHAVHSVQRLREELSNGSQRNNMLPTPDSAMTDDFPPEKRRKVVSSQGDSHSSGTEVLASSSMDDFHNALSPTTISLIDDSLASNYDALLDMPATNTTYSLPQDCSDV